MVLGRLGCFRKGCVVSGNVGGGFMKDWLVVSGEALRFPEVPGGFRKTVWFPARLFGFRIGGVSGKAVWLCGCRLGGGFRKGAFHEIQLVS